MERRMKDQTPSQRVFIRKHPEHGYAFVEEAEPRENPADFSGWYIPESVAALREQVESGSIEGEVVEAIPNITRHIARIDVEVPEAGSYLVIPLSDRDQS